MSAVISERWRNFVFCFRPSGMRSNLLTLRGRLEVSWRNLYFLTSHDKWTPLSSFSLIIHLNRIQSGLFLKSWTVLSKSSRNVYLQEGLASILGFYYSKTNYTSHLHIDGMETLYFICISNIRKRTIYSVSLYLSLFFILHVLSALSSSEFLQIQSSFLLLNLDLLLLYSFTNLIPCIKQ